MQSGTRKSFFHSGYADALHYRSAATHETVAYVEGWNLGVIHRQNDKRLKGYETVLSRQCGISSHGASGRSPCRPTGPEMIEYLEEQLEKYFET